MNTPSTHFSASRFAFFLTLACVLTGSLLGTPELRASEPEFERQHLDEIEIGYGVTIGHVDDDGKIDILLADKREIVWYRNPGKAGLEWTKHVFARNLTPRDNVCLAARDIDGDGLVEIAVGANWNPGVAVDRCGRRRELKVRWPLALRRRRARSRCSMKSSFR